ncbi:malonyl-ACP O-methyltransferase BioC [Vulcaniibacterium gelatinicum]|uniref:malonyl-ACP O-methyltransferase BioC n=1 Tax=Vulcaniibacterium gelatinicum TaxID=2598725 RepID=UPI0011C71A83|nr:malonyl-ACP O-methyltransferase BioC [Vulcaniibacterium gelatinicum]
MTALFDTRHVRRAFSRAAPEYAAAARLQHEIESRLLESLDYLADPALARPVPEVVLDLGCGPGRAAAAMQRHWPKARVLALDLALPMLRQVRRHAGSWRPFARRPAPVCADLRALPLREASVDVLFSNLCLQWIEDLPAAFAELRRVLRPGGLLLVSTFGPDTLHELRAAFASADAVPHVSPFASIAQFGDALVQAGFRDPVLDRDLLRTHYPDLPALMRELRAIGATNALAARRHTLTGKARFAAAAAAYEGFRDAAGQLPASWEVITAMAWAPEAGTPIRLGGMEVTAVPVAQIPIRRRR